MIDFDTFTKLPKRWEIWAKSFLPKALKTCQKSNKSPNLVTLGPMDQLLIQFSATFPI